MIMKILTYIKRAPFLLSTLLIMTGCNQLSELESDPTVGLNGGFEVSKNGLPVNWLMYTPKTVPDADFKIELDQESFKEGLQSLKFKVDRCDSRGGWRSPGFTNEFFESGKYKGPAIYKLSFWIKNDRARFSIAAGGVSTKEGDMKNLIRESEQIDNWKFYEYEVEVPKERWLRVQLNILKAGTFWIDDVQIEKL
jgi:hypothetical protein